MKIHLKNIVPNPLSDLSTEGSEIWGKNVVFESGQFYKIIAPSGAGKSTLLNIIYGERKDYSGTVLLDESDIRTYKISDWSALRKDQISKVFQGLKLFDELTALENILLKNSLTQHKTESQITEMAELLGMKYFLHKKAAQLSFGQKQRIALIRALCQPFKILLLDEPFSHLDEENAQKAFDLIKKESQGQQAIFIITLLEETPFITLKNVIYL